MPLITLRSSTRRAPGWFFGAFEEDSSGIDNTPNTTFDTFPFPDGMSPNTPVEDMLSNPLAQDIAKSAVALQHFSDLVQSDRMLYLFV
ncbi:MAG: hypothetical protein O9972_37140 [Burkholderiales bacterium]|nr:hypothetical protein [Burkholderiales bacterium]